MFEAWSTTKKAEIPELKNEDDEKKFTWREFTENTTFHGVKYVFEDTSLIRR